ncbi:hypothetical protein [Natronoglomus mannanivorans]|uniref:Uncharacterized protein n=1 Tax=Natronoglomus mannanivorans TaxID=2979990 RepID=A0AAP3E2Y2_9EURY|nr:hypothetical protein [Halobacteria archaeon AArc-xg1-1]
MILGLVSWLFGRSEPAGRVGKASGEDADADVDVDELAAQARSDQLTPAVLSNDHDRSAYPLTAYLEADEQPAYVFRGGDLLISDAEGSLARKHPSRELQVVISDQRLLFVMGGRRSDELWEIPHEDVEEIYLDDESTKQYIIAESERDDALMTFFADVTLNMNPEHVREALAFVEASSESESADRRADE